jgi:hypothetical protein
VGYLTVKGDEVRLSYTQVTTIASASDERVSKTCDIGEGAIKKIW